MRSKHTNKENFLKILIDLSLNRANFPAYIKYLEFFEISLEPCL